MECKNCNNTLRNAQKFCDECGAKVIQNRLKPKVIAQQVNEQFISIDNKFLSTFIDLFRRPEAVIVGYINGTRKRYIDVLQYFAIALTLAGIQVFIIKNFFSSSTDFGLGFAEGFNASGSKTENPFGDLSPDLFTKYQSIIYILTVPFYALGSWLAYYIIKERTYNFTEHLVLNLYYTAQTIIITAITSIIFLFLNIDYIITSSILSLPVFAYLFYILKRIFKSSFLETFSRFLLVMTIYFMSMIILIIFFIITIVTYLKIKGV
ncbi:DUF3667 domain-containing protein [Winogradskyella vidalii]|uniref:DUF3667 domain-containing protein n=1 Tax=Winogradskyella vidalii TaxID=2615024 RepID=UPI0015CD8936|nr:DUF3667 domain-containing protein [Winogradskyella vidalii]